MLSTVEWTKLMLNKCNEIAVNLCVIIMVSITYVHTYCSRHITQHYTNQLLNETYDQYFLNILFFWLQAVCIDMLNLYSLKLILYVLLLLSSLNAYLSAMNSCHEGFLIFALTVKHLSALFIVFATRLLCSS